MNVETRFFSKVDTSDPSGCWLWTAARTHDGYGRFALGGEGTSTAHRASYRLYVGPIPEGMCVLHSCDNPPCVNPDHLSLGTQHENILQMHARGRDRGMHHINAAKTHCSRDHDFATSGKTYRYEYSTKRVCVVCQNERINARRQKAAA